MVQNIGALVFIVTLGWRVGRQKRNTLVFQTNCQIFVFYFKFMFRKFINKEVAARESASSILNCCIPSSLSLHFVTRKSELSLSLSVNEQMLFYFLLSF